MLNLSWILKNIVFHKLKKKIKKKRKEPKKKKKPFFSNVADLRFIWSKKREMVRIIYQQGEKDIGIFEMIRVQDDLGERR